MRLFQSFWVAVSDDPVFMRRLNGWLTVFWVAMLPVSIWKGWVHSISYVSALTLWALVSGHWSAWQAARVEVNQEREHRRRREQDIPGEVVDRIVRDTQLDAAEEQQATGGPIRDPS